GKPVQLRAGEVGQQGGVDCLAKTPHADGEIFDHQDVGIAVDDQAGQVVTLAVHHAPGVADLVQLQPVAAQLHRPGDPCGDPVGVDGRFGVRVEQAQRDA